MKWLGRILLLLLLMPVIIGAYAYFELKSREPPDIEKAEYGVQAYYEYADGQKVPTRYYYTEKIEIVNGEAVLDGYWKFDGLKYNYVKGEKIVSPPFNIIRR